MAKLNQGPYPIPKGPGTVYEEPDGVTNAQGQNALRDTTDRPHQYNPDWPKVWSSQFRSGTKNIPSKY